LPPGVVQSADKVMKMAFYLPLILIIAISAYLLLSHRRIAKKRGAADRNFNRLESLLERRFGLLSDAAKSLRDAARADKNALAALNKAVDAYARADCTEDELRASRAAYAVLAGLMPAAENSRVGLDKNLRALWREIVKTEEDMGFLLEFYNDAAKAYNDSIRSFPGSAAAAVFQFQPKKYLR